LSYWQDGEKRWFVSSNIEAGAFLKPQIAVGYGQPHWQNVTAEGYGITTTSFGAGYIGVRAALPFLSFRLGFRDTYSYYRSFLPVKSHYVSDDVGTPHGARAHYQAFEAELGGVAPVLDGYVIPVITTYAIAGVPGNHYVFDESLRGVMKAPYIAGFRLAYVKNFGKDNFLNIGALSELVVLPGREGNIVRVGPVAHMALTDHMDALAILSVVVNSPDSLGLFNGSFGVLGISYRWATGDPHPAFP
jgi:hypothetical protein